MLLTHAHFGHVDGLGLFGRETLNARGLSLYASPSMLSLIEATPQWAPHGGAGRVFQRTGRYR